MQQIIGLIILLLATVSLVVTDIYDVPKEGVLRVSFFDVGQGDAIFITAPNGRQVLIDAGPGASVLRELSQHMSFFDRSIDMIIATHPDRDHIGGFADVYERYDIADSIVSGVVGDTETSKEMMELAYKEGNVETARRGDRFILDEQANIYLDVLFPDRDVSEITESNDGSVAVKLVYGSSEFLFTGDLPSDTEEYIIWLDSASVEADVLKVGHHGSKTSTSDIFLSWVKPTYAVISAGCDNPYGHPHASVIELLNKNKVQILQTCKEGTITFVSDGTNIIFEKD